MPSRNANASWADRDRSASAAGGMGGGLAVGTTIAVMIGTGFRGVNGMSPARPAMPAESIQVRRPLYLSLPLPRGYSLMGGAGFAPALR